MNYKNAAISLSIMLVVCAAAFLTLSYNPNVSSNKQTQDYPDAFMENVSAIILDKEGKVTMKIETPKMIHFSDNDITDFIDPQLTFYHKSPMPWFIESKYAKAQHGIENVIFRENVVVQHPADINNPATVIKTTTLTVHPNNQTAETSEPITMTQPNTLIKAVGMFADMDSGNIKLLSEAQGEYVPDA